MAVTIGELLVNLRASTASFAGDLDKASQLSFNTTRQMQRSFEALGVAVGASLATAGLALTTLVAKSLESADKMGKLAQSTGLSVEQFSGLAYAANIAEVPIETLSKSFVILSKNLEKSNEQTQEGRAAHTALGTLFRGNIPVFADTNDAFQKIVAQLAVLPDGFQKTALASQIFGKTGAALIPLINQNVDGIQRMVAEAREFGVVINEQTAAAAERFNDTLKQIQAILSGLIIQLAQQLLPYLQQLADAFKSNVSEANKYSTSVNAASIIVRVLATGVLAAAGAFQFIGKTVAELVTDLAILNDRNLTLKEKFEQIKGVTQEAEQSFRSTISTIQGLWTPALNQAAEASDKVVKSHITLTATNDALKKGFDEIVAKLSSEITTFTLGSNALEIFKLQALGATDSQLKFVVTLQNMVARLKEGKDAFTGLATPIEQLSVVSGGLDLTWEKLTLDGIGLWEATRTPLEKYSAVFLQYKALLDAGTISSDTFNRATLQLGKNLGLVSDNMAKVNPIAREVRRSLTDAFTEALFRAKSFADALKDIILQLAELIFKMLVLKPLFDFLGGQGGLLGKLFAGALAGGGPVSPGQSYLVGEEGPEIFSPTSSGNIIPNSALSGGGPSIVYNIDARGADAGVELRVRRAIAESENRAVQRSLFANRDLSMRTP